MSADVKRAESATAIRWHRIFAVLILIVFVVEIGTRAAFHAWTGIDYRTLAKYRWSPYGLVRNNPELSHPDFYISANGFRNLETFDKTKPPRTLRVLLLGGSVLYSGIATVHLPGTSRVKSGDTIADFLKREIEADPSCRGVRVEVLNAAINFNTIREISGSYLAEYRFWQPDVVVVFGSANNFGFMPRRGEIDARQFRLQLPHAWATEFERVANDKSFTVLGEHVMNSLERRLASAGLFKYACSRAIDVAFRYSQRFAIPTMRKAAPIEPAPAEEYDRYLREYLGYADALVAAVKRDGREIGFFWEYYLTHVAAVKTLTRSERMLADMSRMPNWEQDAVFDFRARDRVAAFCREVQASFVDPIDALKASRDDVFIDYLHYTAAGNELAAKVAFQQMQEAFRRKAQRISQEP